MLWFFTPPPTVRPPKSHRFCERTCSGLCIIATTNLADNLDKAFERRFLFKIRFDRPSVEAKKNIWMDKLATLSLSEAQMLASRYDFSGGEIDNITRKVIMSEVIDGSRPSIDSIIKLCDEEKIGSRSTRVGF